MNAPAMPQGLPLTVFDIAVLAVIALSALLALARGAVREVLGLASWIGAIIVAFAAFERVLPLVTPHIQEPLLAEAATLAIVFLVPFILLKVLAAIIAGLVAASPLGPIDRLLGFAFGVVRGALIVCAAYLVISAFLPPDRQPAAIREARLLPQVQRGAVLLAQQLPQGMRVFDQIATAKATTPAASSGTGAGPQRPASPPTPAGAAGPGYGDADREGLNGLLAPKGGHQRP